MAEDGGEPGTCFGFSLPAEDDDDAVATVPSSSSSSSSSSLLLLRLLLLLLLMAMKRDMIIIMATMAGVLSFVMLLTFLVDADDTGDGFEDDVVNPQTATTMMLS